MRLVSVEGVMAYFRCSKRKVYAMARRGDIPKPIMLGRLARWEMGDLEQWVPRSFVSSQPIASPFSAIWAAASMDVASDGSSKRRLIRSRRYSYAQTPSFFEV